MQSIRQRILDLIKRNRVSSVPDLSRILGVSKPAVQYHIQKLSAEGIIQKDTKAPPAVVQGRPTIRYVIAGDQQPDNYADLAGSLLKVFLRRENNTNGRLEGIKLLAGSLVGDYPASKPFIKRMDNCLDRLNEMNYQPHWEVHNTGSRIHLRNCPYARIVSGHPELCEMDNILLCEMLGVEVRQESVWRGLTSANPGCFFFFTR